jgi:hypothetical protein
MSARLGGFCLSGWLSKPQSYASSYARRCPHRGQMKPSGQRQAARYAWQTPLWRSRFEIAAAFRETAAWASLHTTRRRQCAGCRRQVSLTAETVLHNQDPTDSAYLMTTEKRGVSALLVQRQLGLACYETAWMMLHKFRRAMVNVAREPLLLGLGTSRKSIEYEQIRGAKDPIPNILGLAQSTR